MEDGYIEGRQPRFKTRQRKASSKSRGKKSRGRSKSSDSHLLASKDVSVHQANQSNQETRGGPAGEAGGLQHDVGEDAGVRAT